MSGDSPKRQIEHALIRWNPDK